PRGHRSIPAPPCPPRHARRSGCRRPRDSDRRTHRMTPQRDIERVLETWFTDGVNQMPDRVYLSIVDQVERQSQRPAWRLLPWRSPTMSPPLKLVLIGAALFLAIAAGSVLIAGGRPGLIATATPTPTPTPTLAPTPTPTPAASPKPLPDGLLLAGTYV